MLPALLLLVLILAAFIGFGALGMYCGDKLQKKTGGQNLDVAFAAIFGGAGIGLVLGLIKLIRG